MVLGDAHLLPDCPRPGKLLGAPCPEGCMCFVLDSLFLNEFQESIELSRNVIQGSPDWHHSVLRACGFGRGCCPWELLSQAN